MPCYSLFKGRIIWTVYLVSTFLCCSLIIYNLLSHYKIMCTSQKACSNSYQSESARLISQNCRRPCTTKECIEIANFMIHHMNFSSHPCEDFSTFACGNYGRSFERNSNHSILDTLTEDIAVIIKDIIETSKETQISGSAAHKLKVVYDSCLNSKSSDLSAIRSMQQFLNQMGIPNWPHLDTNFSFRNPTFEEIVGKLVPYQEDVFVRFLERDLEMTSLNVQDLFNVSVASQSPTFHDDWEVEELKKVVKGVLLYTGMDNKDINRTWEEFMDVENGLRTLSIDNSEANIVCEEEQTREDACVDCSHQNASKIMLCKLWNSVVRNGRISNYFSKDRVQISCEYTYYMEKLPSLLKSYNHRALAHYIALRVVINNLKYMNFSIRKNLRYFIKKEFYYMEEEHPVELDRWKFCVSWTAQNMKWPLGLMYVNRMLGKDAVDKLDDIVNDFKQNTIQFVQEQDWIDDYSKTLAIEQVEEEKNAVSNVIELLKNRTKINRDYKRFHPSRNNFFRNVLQLRKLQFIGKSVMTIEDLIFQLFPVEWTYFTFPCILRDIAYEKRIFGVNAFGGANIQLTFGILLPPIFKNGYPKLFNIAKIGQIIGHEIGHKLMRFLDNHYNEEMSNKTKQQFDEKVECLIEQYFKFEMKRIKQNVKGNYTIDENLSDNMAVKVTEKVAEKLIRNMEENKFALPGLPYTPEQLFYISYAQAWCEIRSIEKEYETFDRDTHSPSEYRIIGVLQNSERFSEVFHCSSASFMNSENKCGIFD